MAAEKVESRGAAAAARRQQRLLLGVCVMLLAALGASLALAAGIFDRSFAHIEADAMSQKARQLHHAFNTDLRQLEISTRDYAEWDEAAAFTGSGDPRFIAANFTAETLAGMHVDLAWIVGRDGRPLYSAVLDRSALQLQSPAPPELLSQFDPVMRRAATLSRRAPVDRLLRTAAGLAAFSVIEIKRTNRLEPTGCYLLFVRFIRDQDIARMRETIEMPLRYTYLGNTGQGPDAARIPAAVQRWLSDRGAPATFVEVDGDERILGFALARDINGQPAAVLATDAPRSIYALGIHITRLLLGGIGLLLLGASLTVLWLMLRLRQGLAAHRQAERRHASIAAQLHEAIMLVDADSARIVEGNEALWRVLGTTPAQSRERTALDVYPDLTTEQLEAARRGGGQRLVFESRMRRAAGDAIDAEISLSLVENQGRQLLCLVGHDISHRRAAEQQQKASSRKLAHMAQHDPLTGLPNRLYLRSRLPRALRFAAATDRSMGLIYLDVDHFKNINDSRGHGVGDQLLRTVAQRLRAAVKAQDVVVRMGGDEFVIVAAIPPEIGAIEGLATRVQTAVQAPMAIDDTLLSVSASMGIAIYPADGLDMEALLKHADIALYQAKAAGRSCHRLFAQDMLVRVSEGVALEQALRRAVGSRQLRMEYQPIIDLRTGRVASLEALMRWRHPELGLIPPSQFIPVADAMGMTSAIGIHALREVLAHLRDWIAAEVPMVPVAVNISPLQFDATDFCATVLDLVREFRVPASWLRVEITETALLKDPERLAGSLRTLRTAGIQVLIDDFGTGYSGLSHLTHLPVDAIKIDRSFIGDLGRAATGASIVGPVIEMARKLHVSTVAEGVETRAQAAILRDLGCDFGQGFYYSKSMSARHCRALLEQLGWERPLTPAAESRTQRSA